MLKNLKRFSIALKRRTAFRFFVYTVLDIYIISTAIRTPLMNTQHTLLL